MARWDLTLNGVEVTPRPPITVEVLLTREVTGAGEVGEFHAVLSRPSFHTGKAAPHFRVAGVWRDGIVTAVGNGRSVISEEIGS
jgi:hypothetical protein